MVWKLIRIRIYNLFFTLRSASRLKKKLIKIKFTRKSYDDL